MERVIDFLAEEEKQAAQKEAKRVQRKKRIQNLLCDLANVKPEPMSLDFLSDGFGD